MNNSSEAYDGLSKTEYYDKLRHEVMSEEEIARADKYIQYFRASWTDKKNRGVFDRMETMELYWEGDVNEPEDETDPGSNTNIINPNIEGRVSLTSDHELAIMADPIEPSDAAFSNEAMTITNFIKDKNKMKRKLDVFSRRLYKFGICGFRVLFNPKLLDKMGMPEIKYLHPAYVFFDPAITDIYDFQDGRFYIEVYNKSLYWAEHFPAFKTDRIKAIRPGYHPMESDWIFGEDDGENTEMNVDNYMHMFIFTKYLDDNGNENVRLEQMSGCGVLLWDSMEHPDIKFPGLPINEDDGIYPAFFCPELVREGTVWAKASAELLIPTQNLINDIDDQVRINARLTGNPQKLIGTDSGIDPGKCTNESALNIPINPGSRYEWVKPPEMPQYIQSRRDYAMNVERQIVSRFSDQMNGIQQRGVDTATEALALQQAGLAGPDHQKELIQETLGEVFEYCFELAKENWTEEMAFKVTNKKSGFMFFRPSRLKNIPKLIPASEDYKQRYRQARLEENMGVLPADYTDPEYMVVTDANKKPITKSAAYDLKVTVGAGIPTNRAFRYNAIKETFLNGAMSTPVYRKLMNDYLNMPLEDEEIQQIMTEYMMKNPPKPTAAGQGQNSGAAGTALGIEGMSPSGHPAALNMLGAGVQDAIGGNGNANANIAGAK